MNRKSIFILVGLIFAAAGPWGVGVASDAAFSCYSMQTGQSVCISNHGNLVNFMSPAGAEHLATAPIGEGYIICSTAPVTGDTVAVGFDAGFAEANFGAPTITQPNGPNTLPLTITRDTTNPQPATFGSFRLKQVFARDMGEKDVVITMTLTNLLSTTRQGVYLSRYFDADVDNSTSNLSSKSLDSVWATGSFNGLMLTALSFGMTHGTVRSKFANWNPNGPGIGAQQDGRYSCRTFDNDPPTQPGDFVGWVTYQLGNLKAGAGKTVKVLYRRF